MELKKRDKQSMLRRLPFSSVGRRQCARDARGCVDHEERREVPLHLQARVLLRGTGVCAPHSSQLHGLVHFSLLILKLLQHN